MAEFSVTFWMSNSFAQTSSKSVKSVVPTFPFGCNSLMICVNLCSSAVLFSSLNNGSPSALSLSNDVCATFLRSGKLFPRPGRLFLRLGKLFPRLGTLFLRPGRLFPRLGRLFQRLGRLFPRLGRLFRRLGKLFQRLGKFFPPWLRPAQCCQFKDF